jgi:hypothetical protein
MTEEYTKNYRILGILPGASWKQLRQAYKKLVNAWHPDRFQQNTRQKKLAEEKTKEITQSYKELAEYYRKHGALPLTGREEAPSTGADRPAPYPAKEPDAGATTPDETASGTPSRAAPKARAFHKRVFHAVAAMVLLGFAYVVWQVDPQEQRSYSALEDAKNPALDMPQDESPINISEPEAHFTVGSSLGEVYTIQGIPTRTEGDIWYYGNSKVYFAKGKVLSWEENIDNPLKTHALMETDGRSHLYFGHGSSKEEVLEVQGAPDRDTDNVWEYGYSRVYFDNNRVTGWHEAPMTALRVRR